MPSTRAYLLTAPRARTASRPSTASLNALYAGLPFDGHQRPRWNGARRQRLNALYAGLPFDGCAHALVDHPRRPVSMPSTRAYLLTGAIGVNVRGCSNPVSM